MLASQTALPPFIQYIQKKKTGMTSQQTAEYSQAPR